MSDSPAKCPRTPLLHALQEGPSLPLQSLESGFGLKTSLSQALPQEDRLHSGAQPTCW